MSCVSCDRPDPVISPIPPVRPARAPSAAGRGRRNRDCGSVFPDTRSGGIRPPIRSRESGKGSSKGKAERRRPPRGSGSRIQNAPPSKGPPAKASGDEAPCSTRSRAHNPKSCVFFPFLLFFPTEKPKRARLFFLSLYHLPPEKTTARRPPAHRLPAAVPRLFTYRKCDPGIPRECVRCARPRRPDWR